MKKAYLILVLFVSCNSIGDTSNFEQTQKIGFTSLFKNKSINQHLKPAALENVDIISGFREAKLGTCLGSLEYSDWSVDSTNIDLGVLVLKLKTLELKIGKDALHETTVIFIDDSLSHIQIRVSESIDYSQNMNLEYAFNNTYGNPELESTKELLQMGTLIDSGKPLMSSTTKETTTKTWVGKKTIVKLRKEIFTDSEKPYDLPRKVYYAFFYLQKFNDEWERIEKLKELKRSNQENSDRKNSMNEI